MPGTLNQERVFNSCVLAFTALVFCVYLLSASGTIFVNDGAKRFEVTRNLLEQDRVDIHTSDLAPIGTDGKQYAQYALGHSLAMIPLYLLGKAVANWVPQWGGEIVEFCVSMTNLLFTVVTVGWLLVFARRLGFALKTCLILGIIYSFGTMAWQQAKDSFEHPQIALYFTIMFYCLHMFSNDRKGLYLWTAGTALGLAILTRYTSVLAYPAVALLLTYVAIHRHQASQLLGWLFRFGLATLPFVVFDLWFNYLRFGNPLETGQQQLFGELFSPDTFLTALWGLTFRWEYGLFPFNPILLLCVVGYLFFYRQHKVLAISCLAIVLSFLIFYASTIWLLWTGGWCWGPRFFLDVLPLLVLFLGPIFENLNGWSRKAPMLKLAIGTIFFVSVLIQAESVLVNYNRGLVKRAAGINGHVLTSSGFKESLLYIQAENIWEIVRNHARDKYPANIRVASGSTLDNLASLDDSLTFGTFQLWWVYALYLGIRPEWITLYLITSIAFIGLTMAFLRRKAGTQGTDYGKMHDPAVRAAPYRTASRACASTSQSFYDDRRSA